MSMTITQLLICGLVVGMLIGIALPNAKIGCVGLLAVPVGMFGYVWWWQDQHPEMLRSTSPLDFLFVPLWPTWGAIGGYFVGMAVRSLLSKR